MVEQLFFKDQYRPNVDLCYESANGVTFTAGVDEGGVLPVVSFS
jgi:hypothetical protein